MKKDIINKKKGGFGELLFLFFFLFFFFLYKMARNLVIMTCMSNLCGFNLDKKLWTWEKMNLFLFFTLRNKIWSKVSFREIHVLITWKITVIWFKGEPVFSIMIIKMKNRMTKLGEILSAYLIFYNWSQSRLNIFIELNLIIIN